MGGVVDLGPRVLMVILVFKILPLKMVKEEMLQVQLTLQT